MTNDQNKPLPPIVADLIRGLTSSGIATGMRFPVRRWHLPECDGIYCDKCGPQTGEPVNAPGQKPEAKPQWQRWACSVCKDPPDQPGDEDGLAQLKQGVCCMCGGFFHEEADPKEPAWVWSPKARTWLHDDNPEDDPIDATELE